MTVSKIQDSLLILSILADLVEKFFKILEQEHKDKSSIVYAAVSSQILLQACSFKDEWKHFLGIVEEKERITKVRKNVEPFTTKINQWSDLQMVRNTFIAHCFRDQTDGYSNRLIKPYERALSIPNEFPDYVVLVGCIRFTVEALQREFLNEVSSLKGLIKSTKPDIKIGVITTEAALNELQILIDKSEDLENLSN